MGVLGERRGQHVHDLATRLLAMRHVEESCAEWEQFLDGYTAISSARGDDHFAALREGLRPYRQLPAVRALSERAREVARLKAA